MLFNDFRACGPISIPTPPIVALTEFFHADTVASVHPLPESWYLISLLYPDLCPWMHIMSMSWSMANAIRSGSCPILFNVLTLNVAICIEHLHFNNFCLGSVADFLNTETWAPTSARRPLFLPAWRVIQFELVVWVGYGNLSMAVFIIYRSHPYIWVAVVPQSNYLILAVEPLDSFIQDRVRHCVEPS